MREGPVGGSWHEGERKFPKDSKIYRTLSSWVLRISKSKGLLIIDTRDYHPGVLYVTREDLKKILQELSG